MAVPYRVTYSPAETVPLPTILLAALTASAGTNDGVGGTTASTPVIDSVLLVPLLTKIVAICGDESAGICTVTRMTGREPRVTLSRWTPVTEIPGPNI